MFLNLRLLMKKPLMNWYAKLKDSIDFEKLIADTNYALTEHFTLTGYAPYRFEVVCASHRNLKTKLTAVKNIDANRVPLVFVFAKNEEDTAKNAAAIKTVLAEQEHSRR